MKDIYTNMIGQNILKNNGYKLDLKLDTSEVYDFTIDKTEWNDIVLDISEQYELTIDKTGWVDLILDYSETYDFQLDNSIDYVLPFVYDKKVNSEFETNYVILTQDGFSILTQNDENIQYQY